MHPLTSHLLPLTLQPCIRYILLLSYDKELPRDRCYTLLHIKAASKDSLYQFLL